MTKAILLDASALLAYLLKEPGSQIVEQRLPEALISAVNYAEVATCLLRLGIAYSEASRLLDDLSLHVIPFDTAQAMATAALHPKTSRKGLSLGDRACIALAKANKLPVMTGDRAWGTLDLGIKIIEFRP